MTPIELAKEYLQSYFGEKPVEDMLTVLAKDLKFTGPYYRYDSAEEYVDRLKERMPVDKSYDILKQLERGNTCCLVYRHIREGEEDIMAQLFEINEDKITRIRLVFDASKLLEG